MLSKLSKSSSSSSSSNVNFLGQLIESRTPRHQSMSHSSSEKKTKGKFNKVKSLHVNCYLLKVDFLLGNVIKPFCSSRVLDTLILRYFDT